VLRCSATGAGHRVLADASKLKTPSRLADRTTHSPMPPGSQGRPDGEKAAERSQVGAALAREGSPGETSRRSRTSAVVAQPVAQHAGMAAELSTSNPSQRQRAMLVPLQQGSGASGSGGTGSHPSEPDIRARAGVKSRPAQKIPTLTLGELHAAVDILKSHLAMNLPLKSL